MPLNGSDYFLFNALGGGSGVNSGGAGGQSPTGAQFNAATKSAGLSGGLGGAGFNPGIQQNKAANLQNKASGLQNDLLKQKLSINQSIMDLLLGRSGGGLFSAEGQFGTGGLLDQYKDFGEGARGSLEQQFKTQKGNLFGNLSDRGLASSNLLPSLESGLTRDQGLAMANLNDQLIQGGIGIQERGMDRMADLFSNLLGGLA